eukprot:CAMPEP_0176373326 /NCGR_PEP_ID=MMETSP0126-20121128/25960_1 /TAXON_ID=141414 ORGANISM="Strombidinopsis acuminatum, Strain SPMC142" /NCGR_SAMPLE_ID=MMETSP0126 /ASSEMBLY_ACC=CAM_ASM_000229 /LENGTH=58 /DNA_ID=CAMNT_0017733419 /DNA_START=492 /DNA_END=671 /DNA_ORIENTATION=-
MSWGNEAVMIKGKINIKTSKNAEVYSFVGPDVEMYMGAANATMLALGTALATSAILAF